jgi:hypothetical protein
VVDEVAGDLGAGKCIAGDDAVAVGRHLGVARGTGRTVGAGHGHMRADIGGDRRRSGRDLRRVDGPGLLVENMRPGDPVDVAALERHLDGDHALRPHLDPRRGDVDLMGAGRRRCGANAGQKQNGTGNAASHAPNAGSQYIDAAHP